MTVTTDPTEIAVLLDGLLAADPVRHTVLGSVRASLSDGAWCAWTAGGSAISVRCAVEYPVVTAGPWDDRALADLVALVAELPDLAGLSGSVAVVDRLNDGVQRSVPRPVAHRMPQRLFRLDALNEPDVPGRPRRAEAADRALVADWYTAFATEAGTGTDLLTPAIDAAVAGNGWLWLDPSDSPVALAARRPVVFGCSRVGPVYTPPTLRGNGYGSAVTAAASRDVIEDGAVPVLFTDLDNPVSNAIYPRLGYRPVDDYAHVRYR